MKLSKKMLHDKTHTVKAKRHRDLEKEYKALQKEIKALKHRKNLKHHHVRKVHAKAKRLHQKALQYEHPAIHKALVDTEQGLKNFGNFVKTKYQEYEAKRKDAKSKEQETLMKKKLESDRKVQAESIPSENINIEDVKG